MRITQVALLLIFICSLVACSLNKEGPAEVAGAYIKNEQTLTIQTSNSSSSSQPNIITTEIFSQYPQIKGLKVQ